MGVMAKTRKNLRARRHEGGYTLVELLVVLAILGLLAAIATPQVIKYLNHARISTTKTEIENISSALDLFQLDVGRYPTTQEGLQALVTAPAGVSSWNGPYIKKTANLTDPWGHPFQYRSPGQHGQFDLYSNGSDSDNNAGKPPIANW